LKFNNFLPDSSTDHPRGPYTPQIKITCAPVQVFFYVRIT